MMMLAPVTRLQGRTADNNCRGGGARVAPVFGLGNAKCCLSSAAIMIHTVIILKVRSRGCLFKLFVQTQIWGLLGASPAWLGPRECSRKQQQPASLPADAVVHPSF